ncbi:MAG: hypothetical protein PHW63_01670 [Alphaproteobacteria bacterium]|nr:hypothetical protein [Alphaproteobacteria bacterium]
MLGAVLLRNPTANTRPALRLVVTKKGRLALVEARFMGMIQQTLDFRDPVEGEVHEIKGAEKPEQNGCYFVKISEMDSNGLITAYVTASQKITIPETVKDFGIRNGGIYSVKEDGIKIPRWPRAKRDQIKPDDPRFRALVLSLRKATRHSIKPV